MLKKYVIVILCLSAYISFSQVSSHQKLDSLILKTLSKHKIPSMTMAYIQPDTIIYGIGGTIKLDSSRDVTLFDKYHIGSNTKAFTSFLAFQLIEAEIITLETKFIDLFPELKNDIRKDYLSITLSDLLSHNACVKPMTKGIEFKKLPKFTGTTSEKRYQFSKHILGLKPVKKGEYSNAGYVLAAMMLEKTLNESFEDLLGRSLTSQNLNFAFGFPNKENLDSPWGHWIEKKALIALPPDHEYKLEDYVLPAGDLSINTVDYSKFIQSLLKGYIGKGNMLKKDAYEKMFYGLQPYSYGWGNQINEAGKLAFHDGTTGTFFCHTIISTTHEFALIIIMNSATSEQIEDLYALRDLFFSLRKEIH